MLYPIPYILHPIPYTLHPVPYTLHPIPYTLHPAPCPSEPLTHHEARTGRPARAPPLSPQSYGLWHLGGMAAPPRAACTPRTPGAQRARTLWAASSRQTPAPR